MFDLKTEMNMSIHREIERYLEKHYQLYFNKQIKMKVTHLVDKGYYYQFHLWRGNVLSISETVWKDDLRGKAE
ncbi:hypothetical protein [Macrococcus carouselicus]|uniref:Uncharacterized protein n=1 Tax=Macrococcus carouselicus TaxID=69969 RepID=A0A9Q8FRB8_9STAP|nr:hypothetical protein [Macrococcus carouselicus]TDM04613.1 hypothetical protein ERX40_05420 [Macrococcus carouselicus]